MRELDKRQKTVAVVVISIILVFFCFVLINIKNKADFHETGTLENCSESASDMPYNNNCWRINYTKDSEDPSAGESLIGITLAFDENSLCNFNRGYEKCLISGIESYYQDSSTDDGRKISVEGVIDSDNTQVVTVVKLKTY